MDVKTFVDALFPALSEIETITDISLHTEGPIASRRGYLHGDDTQFVRFYFNQTTGTLAFAFIRQQQRIWGIDYDNRRGWHLHPFGNSAAHIVIDPLTIPDIVTALHDVISANHPFIDKDRG